MMPVNTAEASLGLLSSHRLLALAARCSRVVVMGHNNPDPDAISAGWAIVHLIQSQLGIPARLVAGGEIVRAENRKMIRTLAPPLELRPTLKPDPATLIVLVDCDVKSTNHPPIDPTAQPVAVIDHHEELGKRIENQCAFYDLRPDVKSTAAIAASYLHEQGITPSVNLATALVYGIRTETKAGETQYSTLDKQMLAWLTSLCDPSLLAQIEDATLALPYFGDIALAFQSTQLYGRTAFCALPRCQGPESVGEIADFLLRCEGIRHVFCGAIFHQDLILSIRMDDPKKSAATEVVALLFGLGRGGGHRHRAGGIIKNVGDDPEKARDLFAKLRRRWLELCGAKASDEIPLVSAKGTSFPQKTRTSFEDGVR